MPPAKRSASSRASTSVKQSRILDAVHEAAADLHGIGIIDQQTMREFDSFCLPEVPNYSPRQIKAIRSRCKASQAVFARYLNIATSSLQKWETGAKKPSGVALKLLNIVDKKGLDVLVL
ncbi:MAG: DNA-binding transcriptional regulator [Cyanobacteria bacterium SZAS LIN-2]|nr:DNA-binding transcriptional regulator [Cyanobacteria bacterium SZAS LIN-2]MBS2008106.1 DNA-binding transcriptional regulator [Cyanobacteria bacterium SZAS TMP-1]